METHSSTFLPTLELAALYWCFGRKTHRHDLPPNGGSIFYNYKGFHSIILMALVDADYKFAWVDVVSDGSSGDAYVFNKSELKDCILDDTIGFPARDPLPHDDKDIPYFIAGDDAFAFRTWLMKPFSKRQMTRAELQAVQGSENRGERFWHPGPQIPDLPRYHETEAIKCVQHSVRLCVPSQPHETPVSKTT